MPDLDPFLAELGDLCRKHGVGIEGGTLFVMEDEDRAFGYVCDIESHLRRA